MIVAGAERVFLLFTLAGCVVGDASMVGVGDDDAASSPSPLSGGDGFFSVQVRFRPDGVKKEDK